MIFSAKNILLFAPSLFGEGEKGSVITADCMNQEPFTSLKPLYFNFIDSFGISFFLQMNSIDNYFLRLFRLWTSLFFFVY